MTRTYWARLATLAVVGALALTACSSNNKSSSGAGNGASSSGSGTDYSALLNTAREMVRNSQDLWIGVSCDLLITS